MTTMKLSDAILAGSMLRPQAHYRWAYWGPVGEAVATCGLGAALDAIGLLDAQTPGLDRLKILMISWPWTAEMVVESGCPCPEHGGGTFTVNDPVSIIMHLNDYHRWTRQQIAAWIATIEPPAHQPELDAPRATLLNCEELELV